MAEQVTTVEELARTIHGAHREWCLLDETCPEARAIALVLYRPDRPVGPEVEALVENIHGDMMGAEMVAENEGTDAAYHYLYVRVARRTGLDSWADAYEKAHAAAPAARPSGVSAEQVEWEWGTVYEVGGGSQFDVYEPEESEYVARAKVAESPTDTGLVRRTPAGPWRDASLGLPVEEEK